MKTLTKRILIQYVVFIAATLIASCGKPESSVVVVQQKPAEVVETRPAKPEVPKESERLLVIPPAQSSISTSLPPLTEEQKNEGWVEAMGECYQGTDMTIEDARRRALEEAKCNAIEQVVGIGIRAQMLRLRFETSQDFHKSLVQLVQSTAYGRIVEQGEPIWTLEKVQFANEPPIPLHRVILRAKVAKEIGEPNPLFKVALELNQETFREGEEMMLSITPTQDCYITVFNVSSDNTVLVLFPLQGRSQRMAHADQTLSIPSEDERQRGLHLRVGLLPGKTQDTEGIIVVATTDNIPFLPRETKEFRPDITALNVKTVLPTYQSALEEINRWLVSIPLNRRAFDMMQYHIRKK